MSPGQPLSSPPLEGPLLPFQELNLLAPLPHILPFPDAKNALAWGVLVLTTCPREPRDEASQELRGRKCGVKRSRGLENLRELVVCLRDQME